jgi:DNA-directed RNA polymerase subunit RPC12/RpoP
MDRSMGAKESPCIGPMKRSGIEHATEAGDQLDRRACPRCSGLLVRDWCYDLRNSGEHNTEIYRCVQCGYRVDPVILKNRVPPPTKQASAGRPHHHYSRRTAMWNEAA